MKINFLAAAGCTLALGLSACSDDSNKTDFGNLPWTSMEVAACDKSVNFPSGESTKIVLQLPWFANGEHSYVYYGKELGIFAKNGIDLDVRTGKGSDLAARTLAAGRLDAAIIGGDALVLINQEGGDLRSIGAIYKQTPVSIYSLSDKRIKEPKDLYERRLGLIPGSNTYTQYVGWANLGQEGFDKSRVVQVIVQPAAAPTMLLAGKGKIKASEENELDALVHYTWFSPLQAKINGEEINEIKLADLGVKIYGMVLAVRKGTLTNKTMAKLKRSLYDSFICARQNPEESINALSRAKPGEEFSVTGKNRKYAISQFREMEAMACKDRGENCSGFLTQEDSYWQETINTLISFKLLRPAANARAPSTPDDVRISNPVVN